MNQNLKTIQDIIPQLDSLNEEQKNSILKALKAADKELEITEFKLERTEKVKKTTAILLEETIEELEQKRKAVEAQNRELEIETALEKVRSSALAMKEPSDMVEVCRIISDQLQLLKVRDIRNIQTAIINDAKGIYLNYEYFTQYKTISTLEIEIKLHPVVIEFVNEIKKSSDAFFTKTFEGEALQDWREYRRKTNQNADPILDEATSVHYYFYSIGPGALGISTYAPLNEENITVFRRFRNVFELAYRRFIDIQQAESQAREAQIEAALERVRSRTMGMQKSEELKEVIRVVYEQFVHLNIFIEHTGFIMDYKARDDMNIWLADKHEVPFLVTIPYFDCAHWNSFNEAKEKGMDFFANHLSFEEKNKFYQDLFKLIPGVPEETLEYYFSCPGLAISTVLLENVGLYIENFSGIPYTDEENNTLMRFGKVFQQTYTRFNDLKQAEAQAREAQIQLALERVRSSTMAMHHSDELKEVLSVTFEQLKSLNITIDSCVITLFIEGSDDLNTWVASAEQKYPQQVRIPYFKHPLFDKIALAKNKPGSYFTLKLSQKENRTFYKHILEHSDFGQIINEDRRNLVMNAESNIMSFANFQHSGLRMGNFRNHTYTQEENNTILRFTNVFEQTYTRFLDLQKAEAQTREAQIEVSLERVRSKAMAMHSPNDLSKTVNVFFKELKTLGIIPIRCGVGQIDEATRTTSLTTTTSSQQGESFQVIGKIKQTGHPVLDGIFDHWKLQKEYHPVLQGEDIKEYYNVMNPQIGYPDYPEGVTQYGNCFYFTEGFVFAWTESKLSEEELQIFRRFTSVLSLTYRRFLDLKEAEARAIEAVRQASLDRVRAEIASMRTAEDLNHITPIIWRELKTLEVPFIRCGVFIVDDDQSKGQVYLSTPDGKSLGVLSLPIEFSSLTSNSVDYWRKKKVYKEHWSKEQFVKWTKSMIGLRQIQNAETYQGSGNPPDSLDLHFVPFAQGMLYVGSISPLAEEKLLLVQTLAEAFSIAYARYEDFRNIEDAKNRIEVTLKELKSAQAQLIHSEKMASLGELTAGIAHEIKNPLNFINNFSEISTELLDELKTELRNHNTEEVIGIAENLKQNLEKINQHGKRADSIVKGMLMHSRGTSGEKVLTNINDLLEQYVNLAYHGMRAQDKEFNITIEKDYDTTIEKINVVPQDISRVFLNIVNNACYASNEKKKKSGNDFSPTLKVSTKNLQDKVEIRIRDNGNGIPIEIRDKLFNPFFTTKPTGEGTGLGLSLSYDIVVKQHSGEIKFESEEGKYTEFLITLPQKWIVNRKKI